MLGHLAARVLDSPLLLHPAKARTLLRVLSDREKLGPLVIEGEHMRFDEALQRDRSGLTVKDGVAFLDVHGTLVHRAHGLDALSGMTSYQQLGEEFDEALARSDVDTIVLNIDSPGGEVAGAFDLADKIRAARGVKRVVAIAEDMAASAAYLLGCAAKVFLATQTAMVGSVGVITAHVDQSQADTAAGYRVTVISSGDRKADGSPHGPLTDEAHAAMQSKVDALADMFFLAVAESRPGVTPADLRGMQGDTYIGQRAKALGLIDDITSASGLLAMVAHSDRRGFLLKGARMSDQENTEMQPPEDTVPELLTAEAIEEAYPEQAAEMIARGVAQERARVASLEAKGAGFPELLAQAKAEGWSMERFALAALDVARPPAAGYLSAARADSISPDGGELADTQAATQGDPIMNEWNSSEKLRAEFGNNLQTYQAFLKADSRGLVIVAGKKG